MNTHITRAAGCILMVLFVHLIPALLNAQTSAAEDLQRADKHYDLSLYNLARYTYEQVLKNDPRNTYAMFRVGECHYQMNQLENALTWYEKALQRPDASPDMQLQYAKTLMMTGDYAGAKKWFKLYAEGGDMNVADHFSAMCDYAAVASKKDPLYTAKNEPMNSDAADYGAAFAGNRIIFSSARSNTKTTAKPKKPETKDNTTDGEINLLYITQRSPESGLLQKPVSLRGDLTNRNEGPVSFSADGAKVAFSRNKFINGVRQVTSNTFGLTLFTADVENGNWVNVRQFPYSDHPSGFPSLSPDGKTLVFASIRPGGFGGWDVYSSSWNGYEWSEPRNLGSPLNTKGNEVSPFYDGSNLYFSSDWHRGLGGLDIFRAEIGEDAVKNIYHLGPGINSSYDDYNFIYNATQNIGYITTNRPGGNGNEDIWQITRKNQPINATAANTPLNNNNQKPAEYSTKVAKTGSANLEYYSILVNDKFQQAVADAEIDLSACEQKQTIKTDKDGFARFTLPAGYDCAITVRKENFMPETVEIASNSSHLLQATLENDPRGSYRGTVYNALTSIPLEDAIVYAQSYNSDDWSKTTTDQNGRYTLKLNAGETYSIKYAHDGFSDESTSWRAVATARDKAVELPEIALKFGSSELAGQVKDRENTQPEKQAKRPGATTGAINGYGIQVASGPSAYTQAGTQYADLTDYGNLYTKQEDGRYKLRLGVYATRAEAEAVVAKINPTYPGAFTVPEPNFDPSLLVKSDVEEVAPVAYSEGATKIASKKSAPKTEAAPAPSEYSTSSKTTGPKPTPIKKESTTQLNPETEKPSTETLTGYAVQVSTIPNTLTEKDMANLEPLSKHGNLYSREEDGLTKVRLGIYPTRLKAQEVMKEVSQDKKFKNAFVVEERGADESLVIGEKPLNTSPRPSEYSTSAKGAKPEKSPAGNTTLPAIIYAVQLGSFAAERPIPMGEFAKLSEFGNLYSKQENGYNKVRLGVWADHASAESAKNDVVVRGFPDATIVTEKGTDPALQSYFIASADPTPSSVEPTPKSSKPANVKAPEVSLKPTEYSTQTTAKPQTATPETTKPFYIRVAALSNPEKFDGRQFRDLGPVERRPQANGTVLVLLGGYASADEANAVQDLLVDRGYTDTYVVKEEKGKLNKVKQ